jgi:hypothetical protein
MVYEAPSSPAALARYLATYLTDDSAIICHVKHRFGVEYDASDIQKFRSTLPAKYLPGQGNPSKWDTKHDPDMRGPARRRDDPLLKALAKYHLKNSRLNDNEREYYQRVAR